MSTALHQWATAFYRWFIADSRTDEQKIEDQIGVEMTKHEDFARIAGVWAIKGETLPGLDTFNRRLEHFAALVRTRALAEAVGACANVRSDEIKAAYKDYEDNHPDGWLDGCNECEWEIRLLLNAAV